MQTGENIQGLRRITDMTRWCSLGMLFLHFYYYCYVAFEKWHLTAKLSDSLLENIRRTGLFTHLYTSKFIALGLLGITLLGTRGRKDERVSYWSTICTILFGLAFYLGSYFFLLNATDPILIAWLYMGSTGAGYLLVMAGGTRLTRVLQNILNSKDIFNKAQAGFPQEERIIKMQFSINLPAKYVFKGKTRKSWINLINPRRGILILGSSGAGKSYFIIENMIRQFIEKGFALFVYDFKYDTLSRLVYHYFQLHRAKYPANTQYCSINFGDLSRSHGCNVIEPSTLQYLADAIGVSRTILLSMNRTWVNKQGDFFVESPINFLAALIWYLRKYQDGIYCTLPHVIELAQLPYDKLFRILGAEPGIATLINPFIIAFKDKVMELLDSQVSSAKIPLGRLASPELYYILTGNDLSLDINDPAAPKILCLGGDPQRQEALAPVLSLYIDRVNKLINQQGKYPCAMICDEFATVRAASVLTTIATARSNDIVPVLCVQDLSQLRTQYSREEADLILNITGNLLCGQVGGETARWVSERFPGTMQDRTTISVNSSDTSVSKSLQMEKTITPAIIATLSSGEFLGIVADEPGQELELKAFHAKLINDHRALAKERKKLEPLPIVREVTTAMVQENFDRIKSEVEKLVQDELKRILTSAV